QAIAAAAVDRGLRELDKRQGWRGPLRRLAPGDDPQSWVAAEWSAGIEAGQVVPAVVESVRAGAAQVRVADYRATLGREEVRWTGKDDPARLLKVGDVVAVRIEELHDPDRASVTLEQQPQVEAALLAIEPATGSIRALVGGFDFERSEFDRATQAHRQTGSAFKPFVYAAALSRGWTLADTLLDEPTVFIDPTHPEPYQPENYQRTYYKTLTLRDAIEHSANIATIKLLEQVGVDEVIRIARRLGIKSELQPYPSLALGAFEISLLELTAAYGAFANQGVLVAPHLIEEVRGRDGSVLERARPEVRDAVSPQVAFLMNRVLEGVISDGTGRQAAALGLHVAGKTGTTDNYADAWFVGYAPSLAVGVWIGFDQPRSLGTRETGAQAALPIWRDFMEHALAGREQDDFAVPPGIGFVPIDGTTGFKANPTAACPVLTEAFVQGTEPTRFCSAAQHAWQQLPYALQRHALDEQGELPVPAQELERLLPLEPAVRLADDGRHIEALTPAGTVSLPLQLLPGGEPPGLPEELLRHIDPSKLVGLDGRPAQIIVLEPARREDG
ncbi:MAG TPA: penicillin-binding transpeptidase domain-containing protein, partial [Candidatus Polarisedimenticolaceae bacterium]|nr:penicillin-binding transpeptidase domain-containing protein [Candidatus Polarisedimenticolaceae bacterium]